MFVKMSSAILAGVTAFAAGAVAGVLFAPAAGERTRRLLRRTGEDIADKATEMKHSATDLVDRARRQIA
jgi:gas vesicle protein